MLTVKVNKGIRYVSRRMSVVTHQKLALSHIILGKIRSKASCEKMLRIHFVNSFIAFQIKALFKPFVCHEKMYSGSSPFQKLHIFCVLDEACPHHDRLKTLSVDGPQLHIC